VTNPAAPSRNLEIKVACGEEGLVAVTARLARLGATVRERLAQVDTYFAVPTGRLKLRTIASVHEDGEDGITGPVVRAELIAYARGDAEGSRWSTYHLVPVAPADADALRTALLATIGPLVTVAKRRDIAISGQTRIHLDRVEGLGAFVELETVVSTQGEADATAEHRAVIAALGLDRWRAIPGSYSDLLRAAPPVR